MTPEEVQEFLAERHSMAVATLGPTGHPHVVAMWYCFLEGDPAFWTYARSQKVRNLQRDPRITCLVEDGDRYEELRGVQLQGRGVILDDPDVVRRVGENLYERYFGPLHAPAQEAVERMGRKRVAVRIEVERVASWDHRKLGGAY
jgi:PPOX class probable F420-dependent enzyme